MPGYTTTWNNNTPVDGVDDNNAEDDIVKEIRLAIHQRMSDIVVDWLADPVVLPQLTDALRIVKRYKYDADQPAGSRATDPLYAKALLVIKYQGFTDPNSQITISFNEFPELYNLADNTFAFVTGGFTCPVNQPLYHVASDEFVFAFPVAFSAGARTITYSIRRADGGLIGNGQFIGGDLIFFFSNIPV